jgi:hypothetical protein
MIHRTSAVRSDTAIERGSLRFDGDVSLADSGAELGFIPSPIAVLAEQKYYRWRELCLVSG